MCAGRLRLAPARETKRLPLVLAPSSFPFLHFPHTQVNISSVRFYGRSSEDATSTIHFKTTSAELVSYLTNYTAPAAADIETRKASLIAAATPLMGHEANLLGGLSTLGLQANNEMALTYGLFMGIDSTHNWQIKAPGSFWSMDDTATTTRSTLHQVWVRPSGVPEVTFVEPTSIAGLKTSCLDLQAADPSAASGVHFFNINDTIVRAYCDMEGGGWMLVLNYVRGGGLTPALQLRNVTKGFPLLRSARLGTDESWIHGARSPWGHVENASLALVRAAAVVLRTGALQLCAEACAPLGCRCRTALWTRAIVQRLFVHCQDGMCATACCTPPHPSPPPMPRLLPPPPSPPLRPAGQL